MVVSSLGFWVFVRFAGGNGEWRQFIAISFRIWALGGISGSALVCHRTPTRVTRESHSCLRLSSVASAPPRLRPPSRSPSHAPSSVLGVLLSTLFFTATADPHRPQRPQRPRIPPNPIFPFYHGIPRKAPIYQGIFMQTKGEW